MLRRPPLAFAVGLALCACGSPPAPAAAAAAAPAPPEEQASELSQEREDDPPPPSGPAFTVKAGAYRLKMTASCKQQQERSLSGKLTLKRISTAELPGAAAPEVPGSGPLLWGQTDLDVESLEACLGRPPGSGKREPIHPSVLVEVLQWNGQSQHPVLLVSTDSRAVKGRRPSSTAGVAMWVESIDQGHLAGVWCRWEVMNQGEGRWEAELIGPE